MASKSERRKRAKERKREKKQALLLSEKARQEHINRLGQKIILDKWRQGKGKSRHQGKLEGNTSPYITAEKSYKDVSATWLRFSKFVAKRSSGGDLGRLEGIMEYVDLYLEDLMAKDRTAYTLTTYKSNLAKVFGVSARAFLPTPPRERQNKTRSRRDTQTDRHISKEKQDFFALLGGATGLRRQELEAIKGTALIPQPAKNGLYYLHVTDHTKGRRKRYAPIMARNEEELALILGFFKQAGEDYVCSGRHGTHRVPKNLDVHANRAEYAKRVYLHYERNLDSLSTKEKTFLRKELKGIVLDKVAEQKTSFALGHKRLDEFRKSYAYRLVE